MASAPAAQAETGQWSEDVFYINWSKGSTYTQVEPHFFTKYMYACLGRYVSGSTRYYYGPGVVNGGGVKPASGWRKSYISSTSGVFVGNYWYYDGIRHKL